MTNPLIKLENLTEPLTKLVEVVATGMGALYAPFGTVRQAKADAAAKIILAKADVEVLSLQQRARHRLEYIESRRQANLEHIALEASDALPKIVSRDAVDEDWILQFFENAQDVCQSDMQKLWGRLLAGEVAAPNSFSKRMLQFLKTMDKEEAVGFEQFCNFAVTDSSGWHFVFDGETTLDLMAKTFDDVNFVSHFNDIGLVARGMHHVSSLNREILTYFGSRYAVRTPRKPKDGLEYVYDRIGFTSIGQQLCRIVDTNPIETYMDRLSKELREKFQINLSPIEATSE